MSTQVVNDESRPEADPAESQKAEVYTRSTPYYTIIILTAIVAVFLIQLVVSIDVSILLAGLVKPLLPQGEYWRLLTGAVLHGNVMHIAFNGYALFMLGRMTEVLSNKAVVPVVFVIAAVAGGLLSYVFDPTGISVGASGGIVGILGYLTVYSYKRRKLLSSALLKNLLINIGIIAVIGLFFISKIDNYGHLGGLLAGALIGLLQVPTDLHQDPRKAGKLLHYLGVASLVIVLATAAATAAMMLMNLT